MRNVVGWMLLVVLCGSAGVGAEEENTDARLVEAQAAFDEASRLRGIAKPQETNQYAEAIAKSAHALALREAALGASHPTVATSLQQLGELYIRQRDMSRAEPLLYRALAIRETALGQNHLDVVKSLKILVWLYIAQGLDARAEPPQKRILRQTHPHPYYWAPFIALGRDAPLQSLTPAP